MKTASGAPLAIVIALFFSGCFSTTNVRTYSDLTGELHHPIRIMAADTTIYELSRFSFTDSLLEGEGEHLVSGRWIPYAGTLPMSQIVYIQSRSFNVLGSVTGVLLAAVVASGYDESRSATGLEVTRVFNGGGSCPYVYVWDGTSYCCQGEVFGTALGRGLETSSGCMLPDAEVHDGVLRLRIADERPETHYLNSVRVCAYEVPRGTPVFLDTRDRAWALPSQLPPLCAPPEIMRRDNVRWKSDPSRRPANFRESLELVLPHPRGSQEGSILVHAINTHLSESAFASLFGGLGDESLPFLFKMETDPGTIALLKGWVAECALTIDVWDGAAWQSGGTILPEANEVPFSRVVRVHAPQAGWDSLRIRLGMLADTWEIDAVAVDWSPASPLEEHILPLMVAQHSSRGPVAQAIGARDSAYAVLLPGESIALSFGAFEPARGMSAAYACQASGYLYEGLPEPEFPGDLPLSFLLPGAGRTAFASRLLADRGAFLPILFARWDRADRTAR